MRFLVKERGGERSIVSTDLGPHELGRLQALAIEALGLGSAEDQRLAVLAHHLHAVAGEHMVFREGATFRFDHLATDEGEIVRTS